MNSCTCATDSVTDTVQHAQWLGVTREACSKFMLNGRMCSSSNLPGMLLACQTAAGVQPRCGNLTLQHPLHCTAPCTNACLPHAIAH